MGFRASAGIAQTVTESRAHLAARSSVRARRGSAASASAVGGLHRRLLGPHDRRGRHRAERSGVDAEGSQQGGRGDCGEIPAEMKEKDIQTDAEICIREDEAGE